MFVMNLLPAPSPSDDARAGTIDVSAMTLRQLGELGRLREIGMEKARALDIAAEGMPPDAMAKRLSGRHGLIGEFDRIARAVRQVIVLELELIGLRPASDREEIDDDGDDPAVEQDFRETRGDRGDGFDRPERQDLRDPVDYRRGPLDVVVADVRRTLGVEAPEDDPFAPPPKRRMAKESGLSSRASASSPPNLPRRGGGTRTTTTANSTPSPSMGEGRGEGDIANGTKAVGPLKASPSPRSALLRGAAMPVIPALPGRRLSGNRGPPDD
jgi:hypothetical protein